MTFVVSSEMTFINEVFGTQRLEVRDVDRESMKYRKTEREDPSWATLEG